MLFPRQRNQHAQPGGAASIEKPKRRGVINSHHVQADLAYLGEITLDLFRPAKIMTFGVGREGTVSDAFDVEFFFAEPEEFSVAADPVGDDAVLPLPAFVVRANAGALL